jgi:hypothetical protein
MSALIELRTGKQGRTPRSTSFSLHQKLWEARVHRGADRARGVVELVADELEPLLADGVARGGADDVGGEDERGVVMHAEEVRVRGEGGKDGERFVFVGVDAERGGERARGHGGDCGEDGEEVGALGAVAGVGEAVHEGAVEQEGGCDGECGD